MTRRPRWVHVLLAEILPTAIVGVVVFQFIRAFWLERYLVPSASMEPVLHGDPRSGDIVLVDKLAYRWGNGPARFDPVVLENPEGGAHLVKRAVAFAGERVRIAEGDLWIGEVGAGVARLVKDPDDAAPMFQTWFGWSAGDVWHAGADFVRGAGEAFTVGHERLELHPLPDGAAPFAPQAVARRRSAMPPRYYPDGLLSTAQAVDAGFVCADGRRLGDSRLPVRDAMMALELALEPGVTAVLMVFEYYGRPFAIRWSDGAIELDSGEAEPRRATAPRLGQKPSWDLRFGFLDGRVFAALDGRIAIEQVVPDLEPATGSIESRLAPANALHLGCYGADVAIRVVRIEHDIHYLAAPVPRRDARDTWDVDGDEIFLLGDNTIDSRDSRDRTFRAEDLLGRPRLVLGPWPRTGWIR